MTNPLTSPCKRSFAIGFYLLTGFLPWGVDFRRDGVAERLIRCVDESGQSPARWILCCGHALSDREVDAWKAEGLAAEGTPDRLQRRTLVRGSALERWVSNAWEVLGSEADED